MSKSLVIVESNAKSKTINRFLGKNFVVRASVGHIKNLPKNRIGVDIENGFEPDYITIRGRGKVLSELKKLAASSQQVLIATDPDREGEAIAQHLAEEIRPSNGNIKRVLFHEITKDAIQDAVNHSIDIDTFKVEAQKARRVMDRLVGYEVSPFLWKTIYRGLSAGRVQSVALRLICEREAEILAFVAREYWSIDADFESDAGEFQSKLVKYRAEDVEIPDQKEAEEHLARLKELTYEVSELKTKTVQRKPYPPYTTSTLQQDAARRLNMSTKQIMAIAQQLYEGVDLPEGRVGLITYMRTDSTRLAQSAVEDVRRYIAESYGLEYVPKSPVAYKAKKSAQDAHEAIRPTSIHRPPKAVAASLSTQQKKIYELIWNRFVACQMASAKIDQTTLEVTGGDYLFRTTGSVIKFKGFMQAYHVDKESNENTLLPSGIKKGMGVGLEELHPEQHFTKPPARFNESSLVKELDALGIGRPSTYALIISTLIDRKYVDREGRVLQPTDLGNTVSSIVIKQFPEIFNVGFTALMEEELDKIESGDMKRVDVLHEFYKPFRHAVDQAMARKDEIKESLQENAEDLCPECGKELVVKWGRNGKFIACTGYPDCRYTRPINEEEVSPPETVDIKCDQCGADMVVKTGRFGRFLACSKYPNCKNTKSFPTGIKCANAGCDGDLIERRSGRGKVFYGCSNYPKCKFASWYKPVKQACPKCSHPFMEARSNKKKGGFLYCPSCKYEVLEKGE